MSEEAAEYLQQAEEEPMDPEEAWKAAALLAREVDWDVEMMLEESQVDAE